MSASNFPSVNANGAAARPSGTKVPDFPTLSPLLTAVSPHHHQQQLKKKRRSPGNPDPDAEVIALSPRTLLASNRFVCEICNKGFPRDQNLQLHMRGHNLPAKLKQKASKEIKKKVYVCPVRTCAHHDPSKALGDITGIKKHFSRKHGERTLKCDRCSKMYAVEADWKAHLKSCGSKDYRCKCGKFFSRRDCYMSHKGFCAALARETARLTSRAGGPPSQQVPQTSPINQPTLLPISQPLTTSLFPIPTTAAPAIPTSTTTTNAASQLSLPWDVVLDDSNPVGPITTQPEAPLPSLSYLIPSHLHQPSLSFSSLMGVAHASGNIDHAGTSAEMLGLGTGMMGSGSHGYGGQGVGPTNGSVPMITPTYPGLGEGNFRTWQRGDNISTRNFLGLNEDHSTAATAAGGDGGDFFLVAGAHFASYHDLSLSPGAGMWG